MSDVSSEDKERNAKAFCERKGYEFIGLNKCEDGFKAHMPECASEYYMFTLFNYQTACVDGGHG